MPVSKSQTGNNSGIQKVNRKMTKKRIEQAESVYCKSAGQFKGEHQKLPEILRKDDLKT